MRVILASRNDGKLAEISVLLGEEAEVVGLAEHPTLELPPEEAETFQENALAKARVVAQAVGEPALADDSGLEVEALGGAPGVRSSRYAGPACDPRANNAKLLREMAAYGAGGRGARFVCAAALVAPDGREWVTRGEVPGQIALAPRGRRGFGYDPLFVPAGHDRTFAEMTAAEKNALSHRRRAFDALKKYLAAL
ncbi:MAG: RdgB/HAM1 family non-canonical purine NTP pyrophosphatase [Candidatus Coatesbacteria bacterium]|nr:MAG: RdgB/HAM1 family non-canonical purine NTP pyrophosphatase [Candidatus Coatesbacteria bacterium]